MSLRVLHVIPSVALRYGGPSVAVTGMCAALRNRGIDARIATTDADGTGRLRVKMCDWTEWQSTPAIFFRRWGSEAFKFSPGLARWLDREVPDFDVVHAHAVFSHAPLAAGGACRRSRTPLVIRPLGTLDPWSMAQKPWRKSVAWWLGASRLVRESAATHYTTEAERRRAEESLGLARGVVIPLGVAPDLEAQARAGEPASVLSRAPYALALGRLHPKKGLERLIDAFVASNPGGMRLAIAGDGDPAYVARLHQFARARGGDCVVFTGWLTGLEKAATLANAAVLVMPSFQENFGISAVEAMTLGVPLVLTSEVDLAEEVERAGAGWIADDTPGGLCRALGAALPDETTRRARGARGRELARARFAWPRVAGELEALYRSILKARQ